MHSKLPTFKKLKYKNKKQKTKEYIYVYSRRTIIPVHNFKN